MTLQWTVLTDINYLLELDLDDEEMAESGDEANGEPDGEGDGVADTQSLDQPDEDIPNKEISGLFQNFSLCCFSIISCCVIH